MQARFPIDFNCSCHLERPIAYYNPNGGSDIFRCDVCKRRYYSRKTTWIPLPANFSFTSFEERCIARSQRNSKKQKNEKNRGVETEEVKVNPVQITETVDIQETEIQKLSTSSNTWPYFVINLIMEFIQDIKTKHTFSMTRSTMRMVFFECDHPGLDIYLCPFFQNFCESKPEIRNDEIHHPFLRFFAERSTKYKRLLIDQSRINEEIQSGAKNNFTIMNSDGTISKRPRSEGKVYPPQIYKEYEIKNSFYRFIYRDPDFNLEAVDDSKNIYINEELDMIEKDNGVYITTKPVKRDSQVFRFVLAKREKSHSALDQFFNINKKKLEIGTFWKFITTCFSIKNQFFIEMLFRNEALFGENFLKSARFITSFQNYISSADFSDLEGLDFLHKYAIGRYTLKSAQKKAEIAWN